MDAESDNKENTENVDAETFVQPRCEKEIIVQESNSDKKSNKLIEGLKSFLHSIIFNKYTEKPIFIAKSLLYNIIDFDSILCTSLMLLTFLILIISGIAIYYDIESLKTIYDVPLFVYALIPFCFVPYFLFIEVLRDLSLYNSIYKSLKYSQKIVDNENRGSINLFDNFDKSFNKIRIKLKRHVSRVNTPLITHDYMIESTFKSIDIFFDVFVEVLSKRRGFIFEATPEDLEKEKEDLEGLPNEVKNYLQEHELLSIDYKFINVFLTSFKEKFLFEVKPTYTKIIPIKQFFEDWNHIINCLEPDVYENSEEKVNEFYDNRYKKYGIAVNNIVKIAQYFIGALLAITFSVIANGIYTHIFG